MILTYFALALAFFFLLRWLGAPLEDAAMTACAWPLMVLLGVIVSGIMLLELIDRRYLL